MPTEYQPAHPPELVREIMETIRISGFSTVHYTGGADEGLLRELIGHRPALDLSVMDIPDRWGTGYAFWYEEREFGGCLPRARPDWLEGVPFYQEGAPDHEISLWDWPWSSSDQLDKIVKFTGRVAPRLLVLFGFADCSFVGAEGISASGQWERKEILGAAPIHHPAYDWEDREGLWIGRWKTGYAQPLTLAASDPIPVQE